MVNQSIFRALHIADLGLMEYAEAWDLQKKIMSAKQSGDDTDYLLLVEHPHTYTLGKTAAREHLLYSEEELRGKNISVFDIDRGGDITYHGPGQLVGYPIIDLAKWRQDSHQYLRAIEELIIRVLGKFGINSGRKNGLTGVWIENRKIAAIGIKISRWITMHGFAFNINPDMGLFKGIVPCGLHDKEVTSLSAELNFEIGIEDVRQFIVEEFIQLFGYENITKLTKSELMKRFEVQALI